MVVNKVELCGVNTSKLPLLREKEKEELFRRIRQGDKLAREEYIKGNLRLVLSVMKRFDSSNENADDLFQIGCVGLVKAVDNFDPDRQVKFSTYAVPMIIGEIRRYLRDNSSLRVSRSLRDIAYKVIYTREGYIRKKYERTQHSGNRRRDWTFKRRSSLCTGCSTDTNESSGTGV